MTKELRGKLKAIIGQLPYHVLGYLEIRDDLIEEWKPENKGAANVYTTKVGQAVYDHLISLPEFQMIKLVDKYNPVLPDIVDWDGYNKDASAMNYKLKEIIKALERELTGEM